MSGQHCQKAMLTRPPRHDRPGAYGVQLPPSIDFVPLILQTTDLKALAANASYHSLLGYNEPDGDVAVDVDFAINTWPDVVATGKRIGSPASANPVLYESSWLQAFMNGIKAKGSHVDFIAMHHGSPDGNVTAFKEYLENTHEKFGLPIWVTEWNWVIKGGDSPVLPSDEDQGGNSLQSALRRLQVDMFWRLFNSYTYISKINEDYLEWCSATVTFRALYPVSTIKCFSIIPLQSLSRGNSKCQRFFVHTLPFHSKEQRHSSS